MTVTTFKHAGVHRDQLSVAEVHQAVYVLETFPTPICTPSNSIDQWFNVTTIVYIPAVLFTKMAIILFYRRIFSPQHRNAFDRSLRALIVVLCCFYFATGIVKIWQCNPRAKIWDKSLPGTCLNASTVLDTSGLFNLLTDVIILLIPIKAVWNMRLSPKRKAGVVAVFTLGLS